MRKNPRDLSKRGDEGYHHRRVENSMEEEFRCWRDSSVMKKELGGASDSYSDVEGRVWNDNVIWVKGVCLQRKDEEQIELLYKTLKKSPRLKVTINESLLDVVAREGAELVIVLKELNININKRTNSRVHFEQVSSKVPKEENCEGWFGLRNRGEWGGRRECKKRRVDPLSKVIGVKVMESRHAEEGKLRAVGYRLRFAARKGTEELSASTQLELSKMNARLLKGIFLGIEEGNVELENGRVELEKKVARLESDLALGRELGRQILAVGYAVANLKAIMAGTCIEEDKGEDEVLADGGVDMRLRIDELENELVKEKNASASLLTSQADLQVREDQEIFDLLEQLKSEVTRKDNDLEKVRADLAYSESVVDQLSKGLLAKDMDFCMVQKWCDKLNKRVAKLKAYLAAVNSCVKKAEARERSKRKKNNVGVSIVKGYVVDPSALIKELESDVTHIQAHVQRGNERLRESQDKLDIALCRERELKGVVRGKDKLLRKKDELLKKGSVGGSNANDHELKELCAQLAEFRTMNKAKVDKAREKMVEHHEIMTYVDKRMELKDRIHNDLNNCYQSLKKHFSE
ncbi:hypothetical protein GIB67_012058, partial [Kingdonia uniflora]